MKIYGLLGKDIEYSFSRAYFKEKFQKENIIWASYVNFDLPTLDSFADVLKTEGLSGLNVTIPYKEKIIPYLQHLDPVAQAIGAVNTIALGPQGLTGFNTDAYGFERSLRPYMAQIPNRNALVLGSGGASKAVQYVMEQIGFKVHLVSRTRERTGMSYDDLQENQMKNYGILINTTPLGTSPHTDRKPTLPYDGINKHHLGFDLIYNPAKTAFLKEIESRGGQIVNGLNMLQFQAEKAWEIWQSHSSL